MPYFYVMLFHICVWSLVYWTHKVVTSCRLPYHLDFFDSATCPHRLCGRRFCVCNRDVSRYEVAREILLQRLWFLRDVHSKHAEYRFHMKPPP